MNARVAKLLADAKQQNNSFDALAAQAEQEINATAKRVKKLSKSIEVDGKRLAEWGKAE